MSRHGISLGWGPVFDAERITRSRRWQGYAIRSLFVLGLLGGLGLCWSNASDSKESVTVAELAKVGSSAFESLMLLELAAVLIIAPAASAGAICLDKSSGALAHVFVTDLTNREIILGKLAARLVPVWGLLACALPVMALTTLLGGVDPARIASGFLIAAGLAALGCSLALMLSIWASRPHEVISVVYGLWAVWIFAWPAWATVNLLLWGGSSLDTWLARTNPFFYVFWESFPISPSPPIRPARFALGCLTLGTGFVGVAIFQVRVVGCRSSRPGSGRVGIIGRVQAWVRRQVRWRRGPTLDADPVFWREWHRNRPSTWTRAVWAGLKIINASVCLALIAAELLSEYLLELAEIPALFVASLATLGLVLVGAATPSVLAEERARGSLDVLMSTPIATRAILRAKWRGAFRHVPGLAAWPTVVVVVFTAKGRPSLVELATAYSLPILIVVQGTALVSLGLALATWIRRTGTATAWTIALLIAAVVGWPLLGDSLPLAEWTGLAGEASSGQRSVDAGEPGLGALLLDGSLWMGSPVYNIIEAFLAADGGKGSTDRQALAILILAGVWIAIYALLAWGLFEATVRTFDRCLGRAPERPRSPLVEPEIRRSRLVPVKGWGWRTLARGGRPAERAASCGPRPR